jgi:hypothetical protein
MLLPGFPGIGIHHFLERLFTCPGFRTHGSLNRGALRHNSHTIVMQFHSVSPDFFGDQCMLAAMGVDVQRANAFLLCARVPSKTARAPRICSHNRWKHGVVQRARRLFVIDSSNPLRAPINAVFGASRD